MTPDILTEILRGIPQSIQTNVGIVFRSDHDGFLLNLYHSTLTVSDDDIVAKEADFFCTGSISDLYYRKLT